MCDTYYTNQHYILMLYALVRYNWQSLDPTFTTMFGIPETLSQEDSLRKIAKLAKKDSQMELPEYVASAIASLSNNGEMELDRKWCPQFNEHNPAIKNNALMYL